MKKFYSFFLSILLLLGSIVSFFHHVFEDHEVSTKTETHFYQDQINCSTCFLLNNTDNNFTSLKDFNYNLVSIDELVIDLLENLKSNNLRTFNLRAPPAV